jgi:hypothetical protein
VSVAVADTFADEASIVRYITDDTGTFTEIVSSAVDLGELMSGDKVHLSGSVSNGVFTVHGMEVLSTVSRPSDVPPEDPVPLVGQAPATPAIKAQRSVLVIPLFHLADRNPLQRMWRDVHVASHHAITEWQVNLEVYGRSLLGVEPNITHLI